MKENRIQLSDHFTYKKLFRYTLPSIMMMIFTSIYGVVDGFFISNFAGKTPFAAVNFIMPALMIMGALGFMFGTGGCALIAKTLGEGKPKKANEYFTLLVSVSFVLGVVLAVFGVIFIGPIAEALGAEGEMLKHCIIYGKIILIALPAYILQFEFQSFFMAAEKPELGLWVTIIAGVANMVLDWLFIAVFDWSTAGAAAATGISMALGGAIPLIYFARPNKSLLRFTKTRFDGVALLRACINGSSEFVSEISISVVSILYNIQLMKYAGEDGVAAYGVIMYVNMIFLAIFIGYAVGSSPIVSFHYGAQNKSELKNLLKKSMLITGVFSVAMFLSAELLAKPISMIYVGYDQGLYELTVRGFMISSVAFLFAGISIYGSAFFTALNNGLISALISFLRTLVFQTGAVLILPLLWGVDGIWASMIVAGVVATIATMLFIVGLRSRYGYF